MLRCLVKFKSKYCNMQWIIIAAIFGHIFMHLPGAFCDDKSIGTCPSLCTCSQRTVDCSRKKLETFPTSLPARTLILNLRGNLIKKITEDNVKSLRNLQTLNLDDNELTEFPSIGTLTSLKTLTITKNKIKRILHGTLSQLSSLTWLDVSHNQILQLPNGTFPTRTKLQYLDLSHNNLSSMIDLVEVSMPNLTHLKLSYNKLSTLSCLSCQTHFGQAKNYKSVRVLELDHNQIATGVHFFFTRFPLVEKLDLSANRFQTISVGVLLGTSKLRELYLNGNRLELLTEMLFFSRGKLKILDMSDNRLRRIDLTAFVGAPNVEILNLARNRLTYIGRRSFSPLKQLKQLYLDRNQVKKISGLAFEGLQSLEVLNLSSNLISLGHSELDTAFKPMRNLRSLDLSANDIMLVPKNAFRGLQNLQSMSLSANHIITVQTGAFSDLTSIKHMYLQAPKLICDCSARWLRNWLKEHSFQNNVVCRCKTPLWFAGKSLFDIDDREFVCASQVNNSIRPEIIVQPKTQEVQRMSNVTLRCVATVLFPEKRIFDLTEEKRRVRSSMNMEWYLYGSDKKEQLVRHKIVKTSPQQHIGKRVYRRMTELTLRNVDYTDVGRYRCHVRNYYGDEWSQKANLSVVVYPYFVKKPVDTRVLSGMSVQISCSAKGSPIPIVKVGRQKGVRFPAVDEKRFWFKTGKKNGYEFGISNVKIEDSGEYLCSATSRVGTINSSMILTVIEQPQFTRSMKSKKLILGSTAVFECMFTGNPKPKVGWFKNGTKIEKGLDNRLKVSDQLLIILGVKPDDAGTYSCRVSNALGMKQQIAKLAVVEDASEILLSKSPQSNTAMPLKLFVGIIVITVICVTILTSVIWVILIWVCKGRRGRSMTKPTNTRTELTDSAQTRFSNADGLTINSDRYTVPPLISSAGSGVVFSFGHLYPDNQRSFTDKDILAHIRGENVPSEDIPLMNTREPEHDPDNEIELTVTGSDFRDHRPGGSSAKTTLSDRNDTHKQRNRIIITEPLIGGSRDYLMEQRKLTSPKKDTMYCSCPTDISESTFVKNTIEQGLRRTNANGRSYKKRTPRKSSNTLHKHGTDDDEYLDTYHNASSSGVESGESSSSSDTVSVTNFEVDKARATIAA